jgi:hypothetical protein
MGLYLHEGRGGLVGAALRFAFQIPGGRTLGLRPEGDRVIVSVQTHDGFLHALSLDPALARAFASGLEACLSEVGDEGRRGFDPHRNQKP